MCSPVVAKRALYLSNREKTIAPDLLISGAVCKGTKIYDPPADFLNFFPCFYVVYISD